MQRFIVYFLTISGKRDYILQTIEMRTTLKDIARACAVDVATASRSLSHAYGVRSETRQKVIAEAARLNYRPNNLAKGLVTGKSHTIAMVISDIRNPFFAELARGAEDAAYRAGFELILCNSDLDSSKELGYVHSLLEKRVDGILMNTLGALTDTEWEELTHYGVPIVLLNRPPVRAQEFSTVFADNIAGGHLAGSYLNRLGHRKLVALTGSQNNGSLADRGQGFLHAMEEAGSDIGLTTLRSQHTTEGAYQSISEMLITNRHECTAIFAANDAMAFGAIRAIFEAGLRVPDDISVIGFDDVEMASMIRPPLTTIYQPKYEFGCAAVEVLLRQIERSENLHPEHQLLDVKLIVRESCRAV